MAGRLVGRLVGWWSVGGSPGVVYPWPSVEPMAWSCPPRYTWSAAPPSVLRVLTGTAAPSKVRSRQGPWFPNSCAELAQDLSGKSNLGLTIGRIGHPRIDPPRIQ